MLVIKILIGLAVIFSLYLGVTRFNQHCTVKFGHAFFTKNAFYATVAALVLIVGGNIWRHSSIESHGDALNGLVVMTLGVAVAGLMVYINIRRTDLAYGIGGSAIQLGLFFFLAWLALPIMIFGLVCQFLVLMSAKPVYVVNR